MNGVFSGFRTGVVILGALAVFSGAAQAQSEGLLGGNVQNAGPTAAENQAEIERLQKRIAVTPDSYRNHIFEILGLERSEEEVGEERADQLRQEARDLLEQHRRKSPRDFNLDQRQAITWRIARLHVKTDDCPSAEVEFREALALQCVSLRQTWAIMRYLRGLCKDLFNGRTPDEIIDKYARSRSVSAPKIQTKKL